MDTLRLTGRHHASFMFKLAPYEVVIWHRIELTPPELHEQIIASAGRPPDEGIEMQGFRDMHRGFQTAEAATAFAESLFGGGGV